MTKILTEQHGDNTLAHIIEQSWKTYQTIVCHHHQVREISRIANKMYVSFTSPISYEEFIDIKHPMYRHLYNEKGYIIYDLDRFLSMFGNISLAIKNRMG